MSGEEGKTPEQIQADIERARGELGETVAALADKTDVKKHAKEKSEELKGQASSKARENAVPLAIAGALIVLFLLWRRLR
jgi:hypothetical protein